MDKEISNFLPKVYGLWRIKEELKVILGWYKDPESMGKRKHLLPKGILFYGGPGCGKTLLMREYSKEFDCPVFLIEGNAEDVQVEVIDTYEKASKEPLSIVIIDELDRLIDKDDKLIRIFQAKLDGFKENLGTLTLATANDVDKIPEPLKREGRFDRRFDIHLQGKDEVRETVEGFLFSAGLSVEKEELEELVEDFRCDPASHIRAAINSAALRYGDDCTAEQIMDVSHFIAWGRLPRKEEVEIDRRFAIHEAGHAAYLHFFSETMDCGRIYFTAAGGFTTSKPRKKISSILSVTEDIRCSLAGLVAEEICIGRHGYGSHRDLTQAHNQAYHLVNTQALNGVENHCNSREEYEPSVNMSQAKMRNMERASRRFVAKQYRIVRRIMKKKRGQIEALADFLMEHGKATKKEIEAVLSANPERRKKRCRKGKQHGMLGKRSAMA